MLEITKSYVDAAYCRPLKEPKIYLNIAYIHREPPLDLSNNPSSLKRYMYKQDGNAIV